MITDVSPFVGAAAALAVVLAAIWALQKFAQGNLLRISMKSGDRRLRLVETIALDARRRLHLVACDGHCLLIETGGPQDLFMGWLPGQQPQ